MQQRMAGPSESFLMITEVNALCDVFKLEMNRNKWTKRDAKGPIKGLYSGKVYMWTRKSKKHTVDVT